MKCHINITGQIHGNTRLVNAIPAASFRRGMFYSYQVDFETISDAKKALFAAWKNLKREEPEFVRRDNYRAKFGVLIYDASRAEIVKAQ